jgi:hypothetical protein
MSQEKQWEQVNISDLRLNGLKLKAALHRPETTVPKFLDFILEEFGIENLSKKELETAARNEGVIIK